MAHPLGRFKAKIIGCVPSASKDGDPQLMMTFKTEFGSLTNWMRFVGERGDQSIEINFRQLTVVGLPNEDLSQYEKIVGKETLIDVKENPSADGSRTFTNVTIVDPDYVPQAKPFDSLEWKKLAAKMKPSKAPSVKQDGSDKLEF